MTNEQRTALENLVFSPINYNLSLDARLQPFLDLVAEIERAERVRCARAGICQQCKDGDTPTYNDELRTYYHGPSLCEAREIWALA
jgi:hypothetical protein